VDLNLFLVTINLLVDLVMNMSDFKYHDIVKEVFLSKLHILIDKTLESIWKQQQQQQIIALMLFWNVW
jgi:hypothetical protein